MQDSWVGRCVYCLCALGRPATVKGKSVCPQCNRKYKYRHTLNRHMRYECNKKPSFSCLYCNYAARRKYILLDHVRVNHKEDYANFSKNIYKFLYSFQASKYKANDQGRYPCNKCGKSYRQKTNLIRHLHFECGLKPRFACICGKKFKRGFDYNIHLKISQCQQLF
ncbi:hypothetical protein HUJ05_008994 [Dendroctonus ponderosae]|nr:hypothetical protein HUJ05_008994 [Dendroctonus ponderosae]